jgi:hypothetical protein
MKMIRAIIRLEQEEAVVRALTDAGFPHYLAPPWKTKTPYRFWQGVR